MKTISYYLKKLIDLKKLLVTYLKDKGISCDDTETFNTLIAKTESVVSPATNEVVLPDFSLKSCDLSTEELEDLISKLNLSNPSSDISYKWADVPNLKKLCLKKNWNLTTITKANSSFSGTPLEELDTSDIVFNVDITLPTTLKKVDITNTSFKSLPSFQNFSALEEINGCNTITLSTSPTTLYNLFYNCTLLKSIDLRGVDLSKVTDISGMLYNTKSLETFILDETFDINNLSSSGLAVAFYNSNIVSDSFLTQLGLDTYNYAGKSIINLFSYSAFKDDAGYYILNENLEVLDLSNSTGNFTMNYQTYYNRHLKKLNLKNCDITLDRYENFLGQSGELVSSKPCVFIDEIDLTNTTIKSSGYTFDFLVGLGEYYSEKYNIIPTVVFNNTTIQCGASMSYFMARTSVEHIDLSTVVWNPSNITKTDFTYLVQNSPNLKTFKFRFNYGIDYMQMSIYNCPLLETLDFEGVDFGLVNHIQNMLGSCKNLTNVTFGDNLGKGFKTEAYLQTRYTLYLESSPLLTHESLMDIINKLYDLNLTYDVANGGKLYTQNLTLGATNLEKLSAEEIAIATNKGWNVS